MTVVTFTQAREWLQGMRPKTFQQACDHLGQIAKGGQLVRTFRELGLHTLPDLNTLSCVFDFGQYAEAVIEVLGGLFPIMQESMLQDFYDTGEMYIFLEPQGMNAFSDEEYNNLIAGPDEYSPDLRLDVFVFYLNHIDHIWDEAWDEAAAYFNWGEIPFPEDTQGENYLDEKCLAQLLDEAGMAPFMGALPFALLGDNPFFVWRYYDDYGTWDPFEFSAEKVRWLQEQWQAAEKILDDYRCAKWMVERDRGLYARFLECWRASLRPRMELQP